MTRLTSAALATLIVACTTSIATAQEFHFELDALNLTPSVSDGFGDDDDIGAETSARAKLGYTFANGAGVRLQHWDANITYDEGRSDDPTDIVFQQTDLVGFNEFEVTPGLDIELSVGLRSLQFDDENFLGSEEINSFEGTGAVFGLKATQTVFQNGGVYGSFETATLFGDLVDDGNDDPQSNLSQLAVGLGYEHAFDLGDTTTTLKVGYETHVWTGIEDNADGSFGFDGLVLGAGISF